MTFDMKKAAVFGLAFGIAAVLTAGTVYWSVTRPKDWDSSSLKCSRLTVIETFTDVPAKFLADGEPEYFKGSGFLMEFVLENHARFDYTLPQSLKLFTRDDRSSALSELKVTFDHPYLIPANERAEVHAIFEYSCGGTDLATHKTTERPGQECFDDVFGHVAGLIGFDYISHIRLDLPRPTFSKDTAAAAKALGR